jgi:RNA polymerase sigma-70 factor (ECF subfamily)
VPDPEELPDRLGAVLAVLTLIFNAGYLPPSGSEVVDVDLCAEALRLCGVVIELLPHESEPLALAAMMRFQHARRQARADASGVPLTLEDQDRSRWDAAELRHGMDLLDRAQRTGGTGPYGLKASIAALHVAAPRPELTDWAAIVQLYDRLLAWEPTPVVRLNRAVAVAMADSPAAGLALVDEPDLAAQLDGYHLYAATRADLLRRSGRREEAAEWYRRARDQTDNRAEHRFIDRRLAQMGRAAPG